MFFLFSDIFIKELPESLIKSWILSLLSDCYVLQLSRALGSSENWCTINCLTATITDTDPIVEKLLEQLMQTR